MAAKKKGAVDKTVTKARRVLNGYLKSGRKSAQATVDELARLFGSATAAVTGTGRRKKAASKLGKRKAGTRKVASRKTASKRAGTTKRAAAGTKRGAAKRTVARGSMATRRTMKRGRKASR